MRIGLAAARFPASLADGVERIRWFLAQARDQGCDLICFPETYLPGLREQGFSVPDYDHQLWTEALEGVRQAAAACGVAVILPMEWQTDLGRHNGAFVISERGEILGYQAKNQIPVEEEHLCVPDGVRKLFTIKGVKFGITICHEGWRYPETVRWAAARGASIVFHPTMNGGKAPGGVVSPFYEHALACRAAENTIYFASVNYTLPFQESPTCLIGPSGERLASVPYGEEGLLVQDLDLGLATGLLAKRYNPVLYGG